MFLVFFDSQSITQLTFSNYSNNNIANLLSYL